MIISDISVAEEKNGGLRVFALDFNEFNLGQYFKDDQGAGNVFKIIRITTNFPNETKYTLKLITTREVSSFDWSEFRNQELNLITDTEEINTIKIYER